MPEDQGSLTALMCAYLRAHHARHGRPLIFDDRLAYHLVPRKNRLLIEQGLARHLGRNSSGQAAALVPLLQAMGLPNLLSRARYTEDNLETAIELGVRHYVILGAGMDILAFRRPDLRRKLRVFEIDHPSTQTSKRRRLAELGWAQPDNLYFIRWISPGRI